MIKALSNKIVYIWIFLLVGIVLCMSFLTYSDNVAYAVNYDDFSGNYLTESEFYNDYNALDSTNFYRDSKVQNVCRENNIVGENFAFDFGAGVLRNDLETLVFRFNLTNPEFEKDKYYYYIQSFVVYECSDDGTTANPVLDVVISHFLFEDEQTDNVLIKRYAYSDVEIGIKAYTQGMNLGSLGLFEPGFIKDGYSLISSWSMVDNNLFLGGGHSLEVALKTSSPYTKYFLRSSSTLLGKNFLGYETSLLDSSIVSVYDVLKNVANNESLDQFCDKKTDAENILYNFSMKKVQIGYLQRIGSTPFAARVTAYVEVPVVDNLIRVADVKSALGIETLAVMQSACDSFVYDENEDMYKAHYFKSVWLSAKTSEGESQEFYLDCNLSFRDYYYPLVRDEILPSGDDGYEYFFNRIKQKCPEVMDYRDYELYGYFGYVTMPVTYSFSEFIFNVCDSSQANFKGTVDSIRNTGVLSKDSYNKLLKDYKYGFLQRVWNNIIGALDVYQAYHYSFYVDSGVLEAFIAHNGAKDMYDNASRVGTATKDTAQKVSTFVSNVFNKLGKWFDDNSELFATIAGVFLGLIALLVVLAVIAKFTGKPKKQVKSKQVSKPKNKTAKKKVNNAKKKEIHKR